MAGVFADKLNEAGYDSAGHELYLLFVEAERMTAAGTPAPAAMAKIKRELQARPRLLNALITDKWRQIAADMRGAAGRDEEGRGHSKFDALAQCAPSSSRNDGGAGQFLLDNLRRPARPPSPDRDEDDHSAFALQSAVMTVNSSSRPNADVGGHVNGGDKAHKPIATHVRTPEQKSATLRVAVDSGESLMETWKLLDGRAIGRVLWSELPSLAKSNKLEARIVEKIMAKASYAPSECRVRDVIKASDLEAAIAEAKKELHNV